LGRDRSLRQAPVNGPSGCVKVEKAARLSASKIELSHGVRSRLDKCHGLHPGPTHLSNGTRYTLTPDNHYVVLAVRQDRSYHVNSHARELKNGVFETCHIQHFFGMQDP
jgi:hypothetical protein